jgi:FlaA1/EpsC-like NDP-sugar epimerase
MERARRGGARPSAASNAILSGGAASDYHLQGHNQPSTGPVGRDDRAVVVAGMLQRNDRDKLITIGLYQQLLGRIGNIPRFWKRAILLAFDAVALSFALWASFALRFGNWTPPNTIDQFVTVLTAPAVAIPIFVRLGLYRAVVRYLPERAMWTIIQAMTIATVCWVVLVFLIEMSGRGVVPRSVPILYWALGTILIGGSRFAAKKLLWPREEASGARRPILIYGAGNAGAQLAAAVARQGGMFVVGFLDDSPRVQGRDVAGIRVFSPSYLSTLREKYGVQEVVLSIPSLTATRRQEIVDQIGGSGLKIRTLPSITDLVSGKYTINQIREIDIDDLLGRSSVPADPALIADMIEGRSIMVTGAGGSIGSELCRLVAKSLPQRLVLFEANEFALYTIERELSEFKNIIIVPVLGSITDGACVRRTLQDNNVQVVFHAAAHKHVPLVEANVLEGVRNNVLGTLSIASLSFELGVETFVLISSDKAVRPTNVMGATKRWAEFIVGHMAAAAAKQQTGQRFTAVRFGNVLGSNGSVVPLFKEQIARGGPVTLTDPEMTRYFMSIHEAAELIVQAGALSKGGDVFLLEMGNPILIKTLAENMIRLAGFSVRSESNPRGDIELVVTGKRPGEKMYEELFYDVSTARKTKHPKIMRALGVVESDRVEQALVNLREALERGNEPDVRRILFDFIQ